MRTHRAVNDLIAFPLMLLKLRRQGVQAHVVHDLADQVASSHRGIVLHHFPADSTYLGGDRRWGLYSSVLKALSAGNPAGSARAAWACAWAVDLDVAALSVPQCDALPRAALHVGSDACSTRIKYWLDKASQRTLLNQTWERSFQTFLSDRRPVYNSGIVGGRRSVFASALHAVSARLEAHRKTTPQTRRQVGADMLLWNWAALHAQNRSSGLVSGYPFGPVNFPMWAKVGGGGLCGGSVGSGRSGGSGGSMGVPAFCNSTCGYAWLNSTLVRPADGGGEGGSKQQHHHHHHPFAYWFGHKLPRSWLNRLRLHACYPTESLTSRADRALFEQGARKFACECEAVGEGGETPRKRSSLLPTV